MKEEKVVAETFFSHPKCYAKCLGDCSKKLSREHYISENILKTFQKIVPVDGFDRSKKQHDGTFSAASFSAFILCEKHNGMLNVLDTEAGRLFEYLKCIANSEKCDDEIKVSGSLMERWFLKYLLGAYFVGHLSGAKLQPRRVESLVKILFGKEMWCEDHGLFFSRPPEDMCYGFQEFGSESYIGPNKELFGLFFSFVGFTFYLALAVPSPIDIRNLAYRPMGLKFTNEKQNKFVGFHWPDDRYKRIIELKQIGTLQGAPPKRSFFKKD